MTAEIDGDFVVFLIGAGFNSKLVSHAAFGIWAGVAG